MDLTFNLAKESKDVENYESSKDYSFCNIGDFGQIKNYSMENSNLNLKIPSKLFLHKLLQLTGTEISFNTLPAGTDYAAKHKHKENEEVIIALAGKGFVLIDNTEIQIKEGSVVRIGTGTVRAVKSSKTESLTYICIQAKEHSLEHYTLTDAEML